MKNYQQTPKQRRIMMAANKAKLAHSKPFKNYARGWSSKTKVGGMSVDMLAEKQYSLLKDWY